MSQPVASRTRRGQALYYQELHKRLKLERSSWSGGGRICESEGDQCTIVVEEEHYCSGGGQEVGRKRKNVSCRNGEVDPVILVSDEENSADAEVGVSVDSGSVLFAGAEEESGDEADDGGNMETLNSRKVSELKVEDEECDGVSKLCGSDYTDVDCHRLSNFEYEVNESSEEMECDDECDLTEANVPWERGKWIHWNEDQGENGWIAFYYIQVEYDDNGRCDFAQGPREKIHCSNVPQESGKWICWNDGQGKNGWIAYYIQVEYDDNDRPDEEVDCLNNDEDISKWIHWNDDEGRNGWIAYHTRVECLLDSGDEEFVDDTGALKTETANVNMQQNYSPAKKDAKVKNNMDYEWVGTPDHNSTGANTSSKSHSKSRMTGTGSLSCPFVVEEEDVDDDSTPKRMSKRRKIRKNTNLKQSHSRKYSKDLQNLVDSMLNDNDGPLEEIASQQTAAPAATKEPLPLKFTFGVPKTSPPQKTEFEKELDELWGEFDAALAASEIGSTHVDTVDQTADFTPERATKHMLTYCHNGHHVFATDDEIGIKCKHCSLVKLEIRHLMPSFGKNPYRRFEKKHMQDEDDYFCLNKFPFEGVGCNMDSDCTGRIYAKGTVWDLIPEIREGMHPHQQEGFEFIWKNIAGGIWLNELQKRTCPDSGNGCIISHAPGTGKYRLTIAFLQAYMKLYPACRPVIIAPRSMLLSWEAELRKWKVGIPFHNLNVSELSGKENGAFINLLGQANHDNNTMRLLKLCSWKKGGGILGLSYKLYEFLASEKSVERRRRRRNKRCRYDQEFQKILLEIPNLLVLDEGHTPRNERSSIWKALCKIQTEKRIILSGTPFQNNFEELFNTLCLVRPQFADSIQNDYHRVGRRQLRKASAAKGKWFNLTSPIGKLDEGKIRLEELRYMLDSFVHIYKGDILQKSLPGLRDSLIVLRPAKFQKRILEGVYSLDNCLRRNYVASLVSVHPSLLPESERVRFPKDKDKFERLRLNLEAGVKTKFLMELIRLSEARKEKVLVFSERIGSLKFVRELLKSYFGWTEGAEILYMDGQIDIRLRQSSINTFNDLSSEAKVLLASKKACSEGINLVGASRVVILDVVWNPSVERQAISRAYRLGQKRVVHVYQLITGRLEWDKYCRQAKKSLLSELVFSSTDKDKDANVFSSAVSGDNILEEMVQHSSFKDIVEKVINQPKESSLIETFGLVDEEWTF